MSQASYIASSIFHAGESQENQRDDSINRSLVQLIQIPEIASSVFIKDQ